MVHGAVLVLSLAAAATLSVSARAQSNELGTRAMALGGAGVAVVDAWGELNPAGWAPLRNRVVGTFATHAYALPELRTVAVRAIVPTRPVNVAATISSFGFSDYREIRASAGLARTVPISAGRRLALGIRADYLAVAIEGYAARSHVDLALGVQADLTPTVAAGLVARNVRSIAGGDEADRRAPRSLSPTIGVGMAVRPSGGATILLDLEKDLDFPAVVRAGLELRPVRPATLRLGASVPTYGANVARLAFGAGFEVGPVTVEAAVDWHPLLGPSPAVGITARF